MTIKIYTNNVEQINTPVVKDNCMAYKSVGPGGKYGGHYYEGLAWPGHTGDPGLNLIFPCNSVGRVGGC